MTRPTCVSPLLEARWRSHGCTMSSASLVRTGSTSDHCFFTSPVCLDLTYLSLTTCLSLHLNCASTLSCLSTSPVCLSVSEVMEVDMTVSSNVLKRGDALTVNCTVKNSEMVYFSWEFPRSQVPVCLSLSTCLSELWCVNMLSCFRQEIEPLTDFLPNRIRSFVNISTATAADSGKACCCLTDDGEGDRVNV